MLKQLIAAAALVAAASTALASDASEDRRQLVAARSAQTVQAERPAPAATPCSCCR